MKKKQHKQSKQRFEKLASVGSVVLLILSWYLGGLRIADSKNDLLNDLLSDGNSLQAVSVGLYQGHSGSEPQASEWIGIGSGTGYGGPMEVALTLSAQGEIKRAAVLSSKDTSSYLEKVVQGKLLDKLLGQNIKTTIDIDGVSGATLSSKALLQAANAAADPVRSRLFGFTLAEPASAIANFRWLDIAALLMFVLAMWVSKTRHPKKAAFNWALLLTSMGLFGLYSASLFSSSTMGIFASGQWVFGLANYTPLILLLLSAGYIVAFNKNIYCQSLCPFGAAQECLGKIGSAKAATFKHDFFLWFPRIILLVSLCSGMYFRNPASFSYEPFGIMFGMVGSLYLFVLTVLVVITSLLIKRPWCRSLCPINGMTDFLKFNKNWVRQVFNKRQKSRSKRTAEGVIIGNQKNAAKRSEVS